MSAKPATITTPIYYVNDRPHIGHAYTTTLCDVWARAMRLRGSSVFFLTGTDEHGVKVERSAAARGITPRALADENAAEFKRVMSLFGLSNDDFIRTTEPRHERQVQALVKRLHEGGSVYLGTFEGWYDEGQEEYFTETKAKELGYQSPVTSRPLVRAKERNYYFRLSAFQDRLQQHFAANPNFVQPSARQNEVLGRLREGLQDVPITRTNFTWGIPFPGDPQHVIYVWIDALFNYITALGLGEPDSDSARERARRWPADFHVIGKEILWFHAVIWPALLMALEMPLPKRIHAHSFWIADGQKMSKSLGNFIDLPTIEGYFSHYGLDAWRWYMATQGPLTTTDADFSAQHFHETYANDLVNTVGNCASRVGAMIGKYFGGSLPADSEGGGPWPNRCGAAVRQWCTHIDAFELAAAARCGIDLLRQVDGMINETEPFKLAKDPANMPRLASILNQCAQAVRIAGLLLEPFMPTKMTALADGFGGEACRRPEWQSRSSYGHLQPGCAIAKLALFPRVEPIGKVLAG
jgi:methionine--tRNA ligase